MTFINSAIKNKSCIGCGLCFEKESDFKLTNGFIYPTKPIDDLYSSYCPSLNIKIFNKLDFKNRIWGNYFSLSTVHSSNEKIRYKSASGGAITSICNYLIKEKIIDKVLTVKINLTDLSSKQINTDKVSLINSCAGSKYLPLSSLINFRDILKDKYRYVLIAKPCEISAIRSMINEGQIPKNKIPILISFFCAGIPSSNTTKKIFKDYKFNFNTLTNLRFRGNGWPGFFLAESKNKKIKLNYDESWNNYHSKNIHFRCKFCPDAIGLNADIVAADPWDILNKKPTFKERPGLSLIFSRTKYGEEIFRNSINKGYLKIHNSSYDIKNLKVIQRHQYLRRRFYFYRLLILKIFNKISFNVKGDNKINYFLINPLQIVRNIIGSLIRFHNDK